jgi:carboxymethylenebutenolidase
MLEDTRSHLPPALDFVAGCDRLPIRNPDTGEAMKAITQAELDQQVHSLYDEYCHGGIERREFLRRAGALGAGALAMAQGLIPNYARAQTISFTDSRIKAQYVTYPSPGGNADKIRGYLVQPAGQGPWPAVLVIHENRGLDPYIEDVARRAAIAGFVALAPDGLTPAGGYPGNDDEGRTLQTKLDQGKLRTDMLNGARFLKTHKLSNGKLGATGFCWGGGTTNYLAAAMGADLQAGVPFYGPAAETASVAKIKAPLLVHLAENDPRINETYPAYEDALKKAGARYEIQMYPGTQHGFHKTAPWRSSRKIWHSLPRCGSAGGSSG